MNLLRRLRDPQQRDQTFAADRVCPPKRATMVAAIDPNGQGPAAGGSNGRARHGRSVNGRYLTLAGSVFAFAFLIGTSAAADDTRTVKVKVSVIDDHDKDIAGAAVIVTPEGGSGVTTQTDASGNAIASVSVPAPKMGESWGLRNAPTVTVTATKDSVSVQKVLNLRSKDFKGGNVAELDCTLVLKAPPPPVPAQLTVSIKDDEGKAVSGAHVNIYLSAAAAFFRKGVVAPPRYQELTNAQGVAHLTIAVAAGESLDLAIEVAREDLESQSRDLSLPPGFSPSLPEQQFTLKKRTASGNTDVVSAVIKVESEGKPLEGANVLVNDSSLGAKTGRFTATTNGEGRATVVIWYASPDSTEELPIEVSKGGYKMGKGMLQLKKNQIGRTIAGPMITLEKEKKTGTVVTVRVVDSKNKEGIGGAQVTLDGPGYYYDNTNGSGVASFIVPETGSFEVRVSEENHRPFTTSVRVLANEQEKPAVVCEMERKATKDEGSDTIEVTVLWKDTTDVGTKPAPLKGAIVKAGTVSVSTDENGKGMLTGAFEDKQEVSVDAPGYKSQRKTVSVSRGISHYGAGQGKTTVTLEPDRAETSPLHVIVDVRDQKGPVEGASIDFFFSGRLIWSAGKDHDFRSSDVPDIPVTELRKGLTVTVSKTGYKKVENRSIPADLLGSETAAHHFLVELEKDWTALTEAVTKLEDRLDGWNAAAKTVRENAKRLEQALTNGAAALKRAETALAELKQARKAADEKRSENSCQKAKELAEGINQVQTEAGEKEQELRTALDTATKIAGNCKSKSDVDTIRSGYKRAIALTGELGKMEKKARADNQQLTSLLQNLSDPTAVSQLQQIVDKIENELSAAGKDAAAAQNDLTIAINLSKGLDGQRTALRNTLNEIRNTYNLRGDYEATLPADLRKRWQRLDAVIWGGQNDVSLAFLPSIDGEKYNAIKDNMNRLQEQKKEAVEIVNEFKKPCDVRERDQVVEGIGHTVVGATIELSAAAELPGKADDCEKQIAAATSPTPDDQVTVPDVSGFADVGAMKAAAIGAGLVPALAASSATPPPGTTQLFAGQNPAANTRVKRGSTLTIMLYQRLAQASPSPSPSPSATAIAQASPSPAGDDVRVPDLSIFDGVVEMKAAASQVGLVAALAATKATPPPGTTRLFAGQDPAAGSTAKKGSTVKILVYQKAAENAAASTTPSASPAPTTAVAKGGNMPNLIGLTIDQAVTRLGRNMRIGDTEAGDKPPTPEQARTIFSQTPAAGSNVDLNKPLVVSVKIYGGAQADIPAANRFDGNYVGSYRGADKGRVRFSVHGGAIAITSPGSGTGQISASGRASISGSGADGQSTYSFSGNFSLDASGGASASGRWSGQQSGFQGSGTWSAARQ